MTLTPRQAVTIRSLRRYWYLRAAQVHDLIARAEGRTDWDRDTSITRQVLRDLLREQFVRRYEPHPPGDPKTKGPPIYTLTMKGSCALAQYTKDVTDILPFEPTFKDYHSLQHYLRLSSFQMTVDAALAAQSYVTPRTLLFEHEPAGDARRYGLHTPFPNSPVKCCPDAALEIEVRGYRRVLFYEYETGADGSPTRVAAKKHKGYALLRDTALYRRLFPHAKDFRVLCVCPYEGFRDSLRSAFREPKEKGPLPGADLWLFLTAPEVTETTFLHAPIVWKMDGGPIPLVPPPAGPVTETVPEPVAETDGGNMITTEKRF